MEDILKAYDTGELSAKTLTKRVETLVFKYKKSGITRENIATLVCSLVADVRNIKKLRGPEKKELVIDIMYNIIEQIDDGEEDTEFEKILKTMVPPMIDSFALLIKINKGCGCFM